MFYPTGSVRVSGGLTADKLKIYEQQLAAVPETLKDKILKRYGVSRSLPEVNWEGQAQIDGAGLSLEDAIQQYPYDLKRARDASNSDVPLKRYGADGGKEDTHTPIYAPAPYETYGDLMLGSPSGPFVSVAERKKLLGRQWSDGKVTKFTGGTAAGQMYDHLAKVYVLGVDDSNFGKTKLDLIEDAVSDTTDSFAGMFSDLFGMGAKTAGKTVANAADDLTDVLKDAADKLLPSTTTLLLIGGAAIVVLILIR